MRKALKQTEIRQWIKLRGWLRTHQTGALMRAYMRSRLPSGLPLVAIASLLVTGGVTGMKQLGWLQPAELVAFDQMVRLQPDRGPDPRILVVAITEADIRDRRRWPLSDQVIAQALANLQQHQPSAIGLDIFRDVATAPGQQALNQELQQPNVFGITYLGNNSNEKVLPPPALPEERVGF
ncbi:MAG TPA: CHASE2 domain-containing protein, partial [Candidatus Obscuribacterales bacterium]